jgi:RNA polymerase sigma factor (sigma-70 family)
VAGAILHRISRGDKTAVQECMDSYSGLVWSLARRMSPTLEEAEDATQEIFIEIWKNAVRYDETQSSETTFITMIARRRLIDRLRKAGKTLQTESLEEILSEPYGRQDKEMEICIEATQAAEALSQLRSEQQKVLQLSIYHGLSHQEISDAIGIPVGTVKTHARRGLIAIRESLGLRNVNSKAKEVSSL